MLRHGNYRNCYGHLVFAVNGERQLVVGGIPGLDANHTARQGRRDRPSRPPLRPTGSTPRHDASPPMDMLPTLDAMHRASGLFIAAPEKKYEPRSSRTRS